MLMYVFSKKLKALYLQLLSLSNSFTAIIKICRFAGFLAGFLAVVLYSSPINAVEIINHNFETPEFTDPLWLYIGRQADKTDGVGGWTFVEYSGIARQGAPWVRFAPEGLQCAFIQGNNSFSQSITFDAPGVYELSFQAANRPAYAASHTTVFFDGNTIAHWDYTEINNNGDFQLFKANLGIVTPGTHLLTFKGTDPGFDCATAIDDVRITVTSEAQYWNPAPLSSNWSESVWAPLSGGTPSLSWTSNNLAIFDQSGSYTVRVDNAETAAGMLVNNGNVTFDGTGGVATEQLTVNSGATLTGAGELYLKTGETPISLYGTIELTSLNNSQRTIYLQDGNGSINLGADLIVRGTPEFNGSISGSGGLVKTGPETLFIENSFTGPAEVREGYLVLTDNTSGGLSVNTDAAAVFRDSTDLISAINNVNSEFANGAMVGIYNETALTSSELNFSTVDFKHLRFLKMGSGDLELTLNTTLGGVTGGVVIVDGIIKYMGDTRIPAGTPIEIRHPGVMMLTYTGSVRPITITHPLILSGGYNEGGGVNTLYIRKDGVTFSFDAPITLTGDTNIRAYSSHTYSQLNAGIHGTGNLVISGGGSDASKHHQHFYFNAPWTLDGDILLKIDSGSSAYFDWGVTNALPIDSVLRVGGVNSTTARAQLDFYGFSQTLAGLNNGSIIGNCLRVITNSAPTAATLELNLPVNITRHYTGHLAGNINIIKRGSGRQRLTGDGSTLSGKVVVETGTLELDESALIQTPNVIVQRGATLELLDSGSIANTTSQTILFAGVDKESAAQSAKISIPEGINITVRNFAIDGYFRQAGVWGSSESGAAKINDEVFTGLGTLTVLETGPAQATIIILR